MHFSCILQGKMKPHLGYVYKVIKASYFFQKLFSFMPISQLLTTIASFLSTFLVYSTVQKP